MVGFRAGEVLTVVHRATNSSVRRRGHQWWSTRPFRERSERDHYWGLHGELKPNMRLTSLMMYISPVLLFILYVYIGFSEAAPRISSYDASPISRKPGSASDTWETFHTDMPRTLPESKFAFGPLTGLTPSPAIVSAGLTTTTASYISKTVTTFQPPTTDPTTTASSATDTGIISATKEQITAPISRLTGARKRSTDAQNAQTLFAPEKMLQTMVSMVSQRTANDAWAASVTSVENSQGEYHYLRIKQLAKNSENKIILIYIFLACIKGALQKWWGKSCFFFFTTFMFSKRICEEDIHV